MVRSIIKSIYYPQTVDAPGFAIDWGVIGKIYIMNLYIFIIYFFIHFSIYFIFYYISITMKQYVMFAIDLHFGIGIIYLHLHVLFVFC